MRIALPAACLFVLACSSAPSVPPRAKPKVKPDAGAAVTTTNPAWLPSELIARVSEGTLGPYFARNSAGAIAFFAPQSTDRRWLAQPLDRKGRPAGAPKTIGSAPEDPPMVAVRPAAPEDGFVALWSRRLDQANSLETVTLDRDGKPRAAPATIVQASGQIVWADAVYTTSGPLVFWAEQRRDAATIWSMRLDRNGQPTPGQTSIAESVRAWQLTASPTGAAVALVQARESDNTGGTVALQFVDAQGHLNGSLVPVSTSPTAAIDLDLARTGNSLVLAWTDHRDIDNRVFVAAADFNGKVITPPRALTQPLGDQAFISLVPPTGQQAGNVLIVYEDVWQRIGQRRAIRLATVDSHASAVSQSASVAFFTGERDVPEAAAASDGFVLLTNAPSCLVGKPCDESSPVASYVRFDSDLGSAAGGPLLVDQLVGASPTSAWNLDCQNDSCQALVAGDGSPAPIAAVELPRIRALFSPPTLSEPNTTPPYATTNQVIHTVDQHLSKLAATAVSDRTLVGWITYYVEPPAGTEAPQGKPAKGQPNQPVPGDPKKPVAASLSVLSVGGPEQPAVAPTAISVRALSAGGLALAPGAAGTKDACIAWVARDAGDPQVFVTRVSAEGKRETQQMLTRTRGDAADVAIVWAGDGWVVGWVDWRDGNGEVYLAKVDRNLRRTAPDKRITNAPGDAFDVGLIAVQNEVFVSYSDARDHEKDGRGDPYVQKVDATTLTTVGRETRLDNAPAQTRAVRVAMAGKDLVAGWLALPATAGSNQQGPRFVRLDAKTLVPLGAIVTGPWDNNRMPTSFGFGCSAQACTGLVSSGAVDNLRMDAVVWLPFNRQVQLKPIATLMGPPGEDSSPSVVGDAVYFVDEGSVGDVRIRRAKINWLSQ